jgi:2-oxoglutarate dehydrogenase E2 component (dihydrolipoamide succinyltransferase)
MGESIVEGTITKWMKKVGDKVERDEPLFEISTDKVDTEIPSPGDGVLEEIKVQEGETVAVQTVVALLADAGGAATAATAATAREPETAKAPAAASEPTAPPRREAARAAAPAGAAPAGEPSDATRSDRRGRHRSSPLVRRIAREHAIELDGLEGTGSGGRVTKKDILAAVEAKKAGGAGPAAGPPAAAPTPAAASPAAVIDGAAFQHRFAAEDVQVEPLSRMRLKIAEHMVYSKHTAPHVTTVHEVDMTEVARKIAAHKQEFLKVNGAKLTFLPFIIKAVVSGLRKFPAVNACMVGHELHLFKRVNVGIAVAVDDGLLVPVIRDADEKSILGQARAIQDLATRARSRKLALDELQGGTFTISNYGVFGSVLATPVINQPQAAVLGIGAVVKRPVVLPESDAIAVRSMSFFSLSFDHRIIDGALADQFLAHVREILERCPYNPMES